LGVFVFRNIKLELLFGYTFQDLGGGYRAFVALPEKALLDLIHLTPGGDGEAYLNELRLQNLERLNLSVLKGLAEESARPKLMRAAETVGKMARSKEIGGAIR
jgi:hypothetical protein